MDVQRNPYRGRVPRCWISVSFTAEDGSVHERELLADTGSPCAVILGIDDLVLLSHANAQGIESNFGYLKGGWLDVSMPELGVTRQIRGFGSDIVLQAVQRSSTGF